MLFTTRTASAGAAIGAVAVVCAVTDITGSVHLAPRSGRGRPREARSGEGPSLSSPLPQSGEGKQERAPLATLPASRRGMSKHQLDLSHGSERFGQPAFAPT